MRAPSGEPEAGAFFAPSGPCSKRSTVSVAPMIFAPFGKVQTCPSPHWPDRFSHRPFAAYSHARPRAV